MQAESKMNAFDTYSVKNRRRPAPVFSSGSMPQQKNGVLRPHIQRSASLRVGFRVAPAETTYQQKNARTAFF
jgi:hypothetical protein